MGALPGGEVPDSALSPSRTARFRAVPTLNFATPRAMAAGPPRPGSRAAVDTSGTRLPGGSRRGGRGRPRPCSPRACGRCRPRPRERRPALPDEGGGRLGSVKLASDASISPAGSPLGSLPSSASTATPHSWAMRGRGPAIGSTRSWPASGFEPGVDAAHRLLEAVRLVEQQRDRYLRLARRPARPRAPKARSRRARATSGRAGDSRSRERRASARALRLRGRPRASRCPRPRSSRRHTRPGSPRRAGRRTGRAASASLSRHRRPAGDQRKPASATAGSAPTALPSRIPPRHPDRRQPAGSGPAAGALRDRPCAGAPALPARPVCPPGAHGSARAAPEPPGPAKPEKVGEPVSSRSAFLAGSADR